MISKGTVNKIVEPEEKTLPGEKIHQGKPFQSVYKRTLGLVKESAVDWKRAFFNPAFFVLLLGSLLVFVLAWQVPFGYFFDPEGEFNLDEPFLNNFNAVEQTPIGQPDGFHYRWSKGEGQILLPGIGKTAYGLKVRMLAGPNPSTGFELYANETLIGTGKLKPGPEDFDFTVPAYSIMGKSGDLNLRIVVKPFQPKGDPRTLGFALVSARIGPGPNGGGAAPPPLQLGYLLGVVALVFLITARAGFRGVAPACTAGVIALVLAYTIATPGGRIWLTLFTPQLAFSFGLALVCVAVAAVFFRGKWAGRYEAAWVLSIFGLSLGIKLAGLLHPQSYQVDIGFHVHNFIALWDNGEWFRKIQSEEWGRRETFYPPTTYVFAGLFRWLVPDITLLLRIWMAVVEASRVLLIFYLVKRATGDGRAGIIAAFFMAAMPVGVISLSFAQVANLFGEWLMLAALCVVVVKYEQLNRPHIFAGLVFLLLATFIQHPGVILLSGTVYLFILIFMRFSSASSKSWKPLLGCYLVALILSFALYHWKTSQEMVPQAFDTLNAKISGAPTTAATNQQSRWRVGGSVRDARLGLYKKDVNTVGELITGGLAGFGREAQVYFAVFPLLLTPFGLIWLWRHSRSPDLAAGINSAEARTSRRLFWSLIAWLATGTFFALVGLLLTLYVRYSLFLLPLVAVGAALALSQLSRKTGRAGTILTYSLCLFLAVTSLAMYYDRVIYYGHGA